MTYQLKQIVNTQRKITRYGSSWRVVYFAYTYGYGKVKYMDCESSLHLVLPSCGAIPDLFIILAHGLGKRPNKAYLNIIEVFYNRRRRHSYLGYISPVEYERRYASH